jgi:uncharacterized protein (TIGR03492 family)
MVTQLHNDVVFMTNGHAEDMLAVIVARLLVAQGFDKDRICGWPMIAPGRAWHEAGFRTVGPSIATPNEGLGTRSLYKLLVEIRHGAVFGYLRHLRFAASIRNQPKVVVALGDILPLAAMSLAGGGTRIFVSSVKSVLFKDELAKVGAHYLWERWLMRRFATVVFPRDMATTQALSARGIHAEFVGNIMMDGLESCGSPWPKANGSLRVALIPGSRLDATSNLLLCIDTLADNARRPVVQCLEYIAACAPCVDLEKVADYAVNKGLLRCAEDPMLFTLGAQITLRLSQGRFPDVLSQADLAIGFAGTANNQAIGCGVPLIATWGESSVDEKYVRMKQVFFGPSAVSVQRDMQALSAALSDLLADPARRSAMAEEGRKRMGPPGASVRIAAQVLARLEEIPCR